MNRSATEMPMYPISMTVMFIGHREGIKMLTSRSPHGKGIVSLILLNSSSGVIIGLPVIGLLL